MPACIINISFTIAQCIRDLFHVAETIILPKCLISISICLFRKISDPIIAIGCDSAKCIDFLYKLPCLIIFVAYLISQSIDFFCLVSVSIIFMPGLVTHRIHRADQISYCVIFIGNHPAVGIGLLNETISAVIHVAQHQAFLIILRKDISISIVSKGTFDSLCIDRGSQKPGSIIIFIGLISSGRQHHPDHLPIFIIFVFRNTPQGIGLCYPVSAAIILIGGHVSKSIFLLL